MLLSIGMNIKLGKRVAAFNLPQGITCLGATELCKRICYAKKAERIYKSAHSSRCKNLEATKRYDFLNTILHELDAHHIVKVRIHESGDFYCQSYLDKWIRICRMRPNILFLAYTKSVMLKFASLPQNLIVYGSIDPTTYLPRFKAPMGLTARILTRKPRLLPNGDVLGFKLCPKVTPLHRNYCGTECLYCWEGKGNVAFMKH